ncbi:EAL domain-containing protein [Azoarcus sp. L1K30]|uniref:sensor domain-containing protein n=1 Tax=Azoarcus sp. L1K30 TaxID=2820277 RepID=UPI001B810887|nr:EAL domain-containing protein [Azoarcus sp. L1K30]MBR0564915.1 EAL domain-containing protein [Azoarcus sp. L1K30]
MPIVLRTSSGRHLLAVIALLFATLVSPAHAADDVLSTLFRGHASIMLFIEPGNGAIVDANAAAERFYGRSRDELRGMRIQDINALDDEDVAAERARALAERRNYFVFPHRAADGRIRTVEVYSSPVRLPDGRDLLLSVIHDVSGKALAEDELLAYKGRLEELVDQRTRELDASNLWQRRTLWGAVVLQALAIALLMFNIHHRLRAERALKREQDELRDSQIYNRLLFDDSHIPLVVMDPADRCYIDGNTAAAEIYRLHSREALIGRQPLDFSAPYQADGSDSVSAVGQRIDACLRDGISVFEWLHRRPDGALWVGEVRLMRFQHRDKVLVQFSLRDITESKRAEERLRLAANVFAHAHEGICITDAEERIVDVNPTFINISGYSREELIGQTPRLLRSGRHDREFYAAMWSAIGRRGYWRGEVWNRRKSGEVYPELLTISGVPDSGGRLSHYVGVFTDIADIKRYEERLAHISHYDALTDVPNRALLGDRMLQAIAQMRRSDQLMAVCFLDLDGFKAVNDRHGHAVGDSLLVEMAGRLKAAMRGGDTVARLGGDEFALLLIGLDHVDECKQALERLLASVALPVIVGGESVVISASVGVTLFPHDDESPDILLRHADQAMYEAKQAGRNRFHIFDAENDRRAQIQREQLNRIEEAIAGEELVLHYQPKVNMHAGRLIGAEALVRWQHPERGLLPPAQFLPLIENHDLIVRLGEWVIDAALTQMASWRAQDLDLAVSVNIAARHLQQPDFVPRLKATLARHPDIPSGRLELEVLETAALEDMGRASQVIEECRACGVHFALDDFGTGYSSLTYFKRLPASVLKIDQSFVRDMLTDQEDHAIVEGVIGLTRAFQRTVIAEGVETVAHGVELIRMGCELGQGYGIARPMPAAALPIWAQTWKPDPAWAEAGRERVLELAG